jgi:hypothetical protein
VALGYSILNAVDSAYYISSACANTSCCQILTSLDFFRIVERVREVVDARAAVDLDPVVVKLSNHASGWELEHRYKLNTESNSSAQIVLKHRTPSTLLAWLMACPCSPAGAPLKHGGGDSLRAR